MSDTNPANTQDLPVDNTLVSASKLSDLFMFVKLRLATLVVMSAAFCYMLASDVIDYSKLTFLIVGGFLVTASSNGFNQIIERNLDKLMSRTANRPLPTGRMSLTEAYVISIVFGIAGIAILWYFMNPLSGLLGTLALFLYTVVYTPLKKKTPFAVFVGAFPGAIPPMLGWIAATNNLSEIEPWILFSVQFMWQFPHFWAIAWVLDDDYKKAGFQMLPSPGGRDKSSAFQVLVYTLFLVPISLMPVFFGISGSVSAVIITICGILFSLQAIHLFKTCTLKAAQQLMFGSFAYLPLVQLALLFDKTI
jgi:protoheme IX farnesyltransferase